MIVASVAGLLLNSEPFGEDRRLCVCVARLLLLLGAAAALAQEAPPSASPSVESLGVRWTFSGELVINANCNSHTMVVGSIPGFVQIRAPATRPSEPGHLFAFSGVGSCLLLASIFPA